MGVFILLSYLRCNSLNQEKGPVLLDSIQNAVAVSRSYQSNVPAKRQDRVQSVLETPGDQKSDENMSVPLGENKGVYQMMYCVGRNLHCSHSAEAEPQGCRFTRKALRAVGSMYQSKLGLSAAFSKVLSACTGTSISFDFIMEKAQGEEQTTKNNEGQRLSLLKEERATEAG